MLKLGLFVALLAGACGGKKAAPTWHEKHPDTIEPTTVLKKIFQDARAYVASTEKLPPAAAVTPPPGSCCKGRRKHCEPDRAFWTGPGWRELDFDALDGVAFDYSYEVRPDKDGLRIDAYGDLDCDGTYSTFELVGSLAAGGLDLGDAPITRVNEQE
jgi:hypothetical protein